MIKTDELESTIGKYYKNVPHLPKEARTWLADNVWWLAWIGAALSIVGLVVVIPAFLAAVSLTTYVSSVYTPYYNAAGGLGWFSLVVSLIGYVVTTALLIAAVKPLKAQSKKGWTFIFWSYITNFILNIVSAVVVFSFYNIFTSIVSAAIAGYFLYEIRSHFVTHHKAAHKAEKK
jgi:hypothetical protein